MGEQELKDILESHRKWLNNEPGGVRADLSGKDLSKRDLSYANLSYANLSYANLRLANLRLANLSYANLSYANLSYANLSDANLSDANLSDANLRLANLSDANLSDANLSDANLSDANLRLANLAPNCKGIHIGGTKYNINIAKDFVQWGCRRFTFEEIDKLTLKDCKDTTWTAEEFENCRLFIQFAIATYRKAGA